MELLASEDRAFDLARIISVLSSLPEGQVLKALLDSEAGGIAAACRAARLGERGYRGVLALRGGRLQQTPKQLEREVAAYLDADPMVA